MNYILLALIITPIIILFIWIDGINRKYQIKIESLERLIYKVHDEVNSIKREKEN